jgi:RNase H-like domain found in reverse transcriptase
MDVRMPRGLYQNKGSYVTPYDIVVPRLHKTIPHSYWCIPISSGRSHQFHQGGVISQKNKPPSFYFHKLNQAQLNYSTIEQELLSIVEILREFCDILLGHKIVIFTDHKNVSFSNFTSSRVLCWRLKIEEFGPTIKYVKGSNNTVANALSGLSFFTLYSTEELLAAVQYDPPDDFPASFSIISKYQKEKHELQSSLAKHPEKYESRVVHKSTIIFQANSERIVISKGLQLQIIKFYHDNLKHPGVTRTLLTLQHFWFGPRCNPPLSNPSISVLFVRCIGNPPISMVNVQQKFP